MVVASFLINKSHDSIFGSDKVLLVLLKPLHDPQSLAFSLISSSFLFDDFSIRLLVFPASGQILSISIAISCRGYPPCCFTILIKVSIPWCSSNLSYFGAPGVHWNCYLICHIKIAGIPCSHSQPWIREKCMEIIIYPENEGVTAEECVFHRPKQEYLQGLCWDNGAEEEMREYGGLQKKGSGDTEFRYSNCSNPYGERNRRCDWYERLFW